MTSRAFDYSSRFRRSPACSWSALGDEVLILDMNGRKSHRLTGSGGLIWQSAVAGRPLSDVIDSVTERFEVSREQASTDTEALISQLLSLGVLELA